MSKLPDDLDVREMDCLVVGGVADGALLRININAERIELGRPTHLKPLESPTQLEPEAAKESDIYNVSMFWLPTETNQPYPFGLAIVDGHSPAWAVKELTVAYVQITTHRLLEDSKKETLQ